MSTMQNWNCEQCTFENFKDLNYCEICAKSRPKQKNAQNENNDTNHERTQPMQSIEPNSINTNAFVVSANNNNDNTNNTNNVYIKLKAMGYDNAICNKAALQYPNNLNRAINFALSNASNLSKDEEFAKKIHKHDKALQIELQKKLSILRETVQTNNKITIQIAVQNSNSNNKNMFPQTKNDLKNELLKNPCIESTLSNNLKCILCNVNCPPKNMREHLNGKRHSKAVKQQKLQLKLTAKANKKRKLHHVIGMSDQETKLKKRKLHPNLHPLLKDTKKRQINGSNYSDGANNRSICVRIIPQHYTRRRLRAELEDLYNVLIVRCEDLEPDIMLTPFLICKRIELNNIGSKNKLLNLCTQSKLILNGQSVISATQYISAVKKDNNNLLEMPSLQQVDDDENNKKHNLIVSDVAIKDIHVEMDQEKEAMIRKERRIKQEQINNNNGYLMENSQRKENNSMEIMTDDIIVKKEIIMKSKLKLMNVNNNRNKKEQNISDEENEEINIVKDNLNERKNGTIMILENHLNVKYCPKCRDEVIRTDKDIKNSCSVMTCIKCGVGKHYTYWCWDCSNIISVEDLSFHPDTNEPGGACRKCRKLSRKKRNKCKKPVYKI